MCIVMVIVIGQKNPLSLLLSLYCMSSLLLSLDTGVIMFVVLVMSTVVAIMVLMVGLIVVLGAIMDVIVIVITAIVAVAVCVVFAFVVVIIGTLAVTI